jgi:uncharacterized protein YegL
MMIHERFLQLFICLAIFLSQAESSAILSTYHVTTNIHSRFEETYIAMAFNNSHQNCSEVLDMSLSLPLGARVTELTLTLSDGCVLTSAVKNLNEAIQDFEEQVGQGRPAALLTAWDMTNYQLRVSVPALGYTRVGLHYQEILWRKLHKIPFQVPFFPGLDVEHLIVDIAVEESNTGIADFHLEDLELSTSYGGLFLDIKAGTNITTAHYEGFLVPQDASLPGLLQAYYDAGPLPEEGLLISEGGCVTHLFNPSEFLASAGSMARNIVFVIDVSGSMDGQKLEDAKAAFTVMIQTLQEQDTVRIHSFSNSGTEDAWGPEFATATSKTSAVSFVNSLRTIGSTNLNDAYLNGISQVYQSEETVVPILVILSDGQATTGETSPPSIARNVRLANEGRRVKIFSLAFGLGADLDLLLGISIQNGGIARQIFEGFEDAVTQMETFFLAELGSVLLSDINIHFVAEDGLELLDSTQLEYPVLADGSDIVIYGKFNQPPSSISRNGNAVATRLQVITSAVSSLGPQSWTMESEIEQESSSTPAFSECRQSFAHARIVELLALRDAERVLGDELFIDSIYDQSVSFEDLATELALKAGLVWPGLTAMVTIESDTCGEDSNVVCRDAYGQGVGDEQGEDDNRDESLSTSGSTSSPAAPVSSPGPRPGFATTDGSPTSGRGVSNTADSSGASYSDLGSDDDYGDDAGEKTMASTSLSNFFSLSWAVFSLLLYLI